jgi:deoxyhypusine monooxygenase
LRSSIGFSGDSALLKHELAYCLGQTKKTAALPTLVQVLQDEKEDPMVRHEVNSNFCYVVRCLFHAWQAAEAMGAISSKDSIPILRQYLHDSNRSVRETCEIALAKIEWDHSEEGRHEIGASTDKLNP